MPQGNKKTQRPPHPQGVRRVLFQLHSDWLAPRQQHRSACRDQGPEWPRCRREGGGVVLEVIVLSGYSCTGPDLSVRRHNTINLFGLWKPLGLGGQAANSPSHLVLPVLGWVTGPARGGAGGWGVWFRAGVSHGVKSRGRALGFQKPWVLTPPLCVNRLAAVREECTRRRGG